MADDGGSARVTGPRYVKVDGERPDGVETGCLRPLGLCDLGGCCDICWYGQSNADARAAAADSSPHDPRER